MADITNSKLLHTDTGILNKDACIVLVKTEWNAAIVDQLERGCIAILEQHAVKKIIILTVPGAVEIPFAIKSYWAVSYTHLDVYKRQYQENQIQIPPGLY